MDQLEREVGFAGRVQWELVGTQEVHMAQALASGISIPHYLAGGDYYDLLPLDNGHLRMVVADVMGKGFGASMLMTMIRAGVRTASRQRQSPGQLLSLMNDLFFADLQRLDSFITLCCLDYDPNRCACTVACAGHPSPLLLRAGVVESESLRVRGVALGLIPHRQYSEIEVPLAPGDLLLLYTDGTVEAQNIHGQELSTAGLTRLLAGLSSLPLPGLLRRILEEVAVHTGGQGPRDDVTLAVLRLED